WFRGLYGAAQAAEQNGDKENASRYYAKLATQTKKSAGSRDELNHVREFLTAQAKATADTTAVAGGRGEKKNGASCVQNDQASRTALVIAASLVLLHRDPKYSGFVSRTSADLCAQMLDGHSGQTRFLLKLVRQGWFRPIAKLIERITIPGILLHYVLR